MAYIAYAGESQDFVQCPDTDLADPTGDFELITCFELNDWNLTNWVPVITKHSGSTITYILQLRQNASGHYLQAEVRDNSNVTYLAQSSIDAPVTAATGPRWYRMLYVHDTGAGNYSVDWYYSDDPETTAVGSVSWTAMGAQDTGPNATINNTTANTMLLGTTFDGNQLLAAGKLFCASIRYGGTEVADPDFRDGTQTSDGGLTFVDSYGNVWTVEAPNSWETGAFDIIKVQTE